MYSAVLDTIEAVLGIVGRGNRNKGAVAECPWAELGPGTESLTPNGAEELRGWTKSHLDVGGQNHLVIEAILQLC